MLPRSFKPAMLRGVTAVDSAGTIGLSFNVAGRDPIRIKIGPESAIALVGSVFEMFTERVIRPIPVMPRVPRPRARRRRRKS
jgi:hypothetical protein